MSSREIHPRRRRRFEAGGFAGSVAPFGYRRELGELVLDNEEAEIVRLVFSEYLDRSSISCVVRLLHERGLRTRRGSKWAPQTVAAVLRNPAAIGRVRYHGAEGQGRHAPLVDRETFEAVARRLSANDRHGLASTTERARVALSSGGGAMSPGRPARSGVTRAVLRLRALRAVGFSTRPAPLNAIEEETCTPC